MRTGRKVGRGEVNKGTKGGDCHCTSRIVRRKNCVFYCQNKNQCDDTTAGFEYLTYHHKTYPILIACLKDYSSKEKTPPSTDPYCSGVSSMYPELEANLGSEIVFELMRTASMFLCSSWCEDISEAGELHDQVFADGKFAGDAGGGRFEGGWHDQVARETTNDCARRTSARYANG